MSTQSKILEQIQRKVQKKRELSEQIKDRRSLLRKKIIKAIDEINQDYILVKESGGYIDNVMLRDISTAAIRNEVHRIDKEAKVSFIYHDDPNSCCCVSAVTIQWSKKYIDATGSNYETTIDIMDSLFETI